MDLTRPRLFRLHTIHRKLCAGHRFSAPSMAEEVEVDTRTVQRDIEYMRDLLDAPIVWDRAMRSYRYSEPCFELPDVLMTEGELIALVIADQIIGDLGGSPLGSKVRGAMDKLLKHLPAHVAVSIEALEAGLAARPASSVATAATALPTLLNAMQQKTSVIIDYKGPNAEPARRMIDPLHIFLHRDSWYVLAYCHLRGALRQFKMMTWLYRGTAFIISAAIGRRPH
jgi:predicted DNA-binding transcriptional regulator YafY